jgi:hypothetical protein
MKMQLRKIQKKNVIAKHAETDLHRVSHAMCLHNGGSNFKIIIFTSMLNLIKLLNTIFEKKT